MSPNVEGHPRTSDSPSTVSDADETDGLTPDDVFHILQTNRRRDAIGYLLERDGPAKMRDIAEYVAAKENETTVSRLSSAQRQRVYIPLYQSHLPKLDTEGVIEYDKPRGIVRATDRLEIFRPYLEMSDNEIDRTESGRSEASYFGAATTASIGLLLAVKIGILAASGLLVGVAITLLFLTAATVSSGVESRISNRSAESRGTDA